jgi:hypothetical protein
VKKKAATGHKDVVHRLWLAKQRSGYPSDVSDEEWAFCTPYLTLMRRTLRNANIPFARAALKP